MKDKIQKIISNILLGLFIGISLFSVFTPVKAEQFEYKVLEPLPGVGVKDGKTNLEEYIPAVFKIAIGLSAVAAVLMIVLGGFQYISTDAVQGKSEGKQRILNAVYGLILVIGAYLILYTVNPNLLNLNLNIDTVETAQQYGPGGTLLPGGASPASNPCTTAGSSGCTQDAANKKTLEDAQIKAYAGPCIGNQTKNCVNLDGLTPATISGAINLKNTCKCTILITGGSEGGHSLTGGHPTGTALDVDINSAGLTTYIKSNIKSTATKPLGTEYTVNVNGKDVRFLEESKPPHWHINF